MHLKSFACQLWITHGSTNPTTAARTRNVEGLMITYDRQCVKEGLTVYNQVWNADTTEGQEDGISKLLSLLPEPSEARSYGTSTTADTDTDHGERVFRDKVKNVDTGTSGAVGGVDGGGLAALRTGLIGLLGEGTVKALERSTSRKSIIRFEPGLGLDALLLIVNNPMKGIDMTGYCV